MSLLRPAFEHLLASSRRFFRIEAASGLVLMGCALAALAWANSPWGEGYFAFWHTEFSVSLGRVGLAKPLHLWINDGLMAVFFFVVGLEIKREILVGELSTPGQAALPIAAALGGMLVPALVYLACTWSTAEARGWGVPMATDIAFALGVLALLGRRVPASLKIFLTAVAIADDVGAVLVIALVYTADLAPAWLGLAAGLLGLMVLLNLAGVRSPLPYLLVGVILWLAVLKSGVHATVAGVLAAMTIPARTGCTPADFLAKAGELLARFEARLDPGRCILTNKAQRAALEELEESCRAAASPLMRVEHALHPWVAYGVMPVFALANAGVGLSLDSLGRTAADPAAWGVALGLVLGKQAGVILGSVLVLRLGLALPPAGMTGRHFWGAGLLAGIGFTMSIFIAGLAFPQAPASEEAVKVSILAASLVSGLAGGLLLRTAPRS